MICWLPRALRLVRAGEGINSLSVVGPLFYLCLSVSGRCFRFFLVLSFAVLEFVVVVVGFAYA